MVFSVQRLADSVVEERKMSEDPQRVSMACRGMEVGGGKSK